MKYDKVAGPTFFDGFIWRSNDRNSYVVVRFSTKIILNEQDDMDRLLQTGQLIINQ